MGPGPSWSICRHVLLVPAGIDPDSSTPLVNNLFCLPKTNRLPVISPAINTASLFKISKELQFRVCNHGKPHASPVVTRRRGFIYRGKGRWEGYGKQRVHWRNGEFRLLSIDWVVKALIDWALARQQKQFFFLLLGSAITIGCESSHFWSPDSILIEASVYSFLYFLPLYISARAALMEPSWDLTQVVGIGEYNIQHYPWTAASLPISLLKHTFVTHPDLANWNFWGGGDWHV